MYLKITDKTANGEIGEVESRDGRFSWFWGADGYLQDNKLNKSIYQMYFMPGEGEGFGGEKITDKEMIALVRDFWTSLHALQNQEKNDREKAEMIENDRLAALPPSISKDQTCPDCGTLCYGDCKS